MSLSVPPALQEKLRAGELITDVAFIETIKTSLPHAWEIFKRLGGEVSRTGASAEYAPQSMDPQQRGELLRALASTSIRTALERHFGVAIAFQNCHKTRFFPIDAIGGEEYRNFVSAEAQLANQSPDLVDC